MTDAPSANQAEQSSGTDPRSKRNSGLFAIFKWFKSGSRESFHEYDSSRSSSLESVASDKSSGTVASFRFVAPNVYEKEVDRKQVLIGPETDTYRARLKQRDKRRESDKNVTLRKKYNLFFNRDTLLHPQKPLIEDDENSKSLPLMTRAHIMEVEPQKVHRRTISESSKIKRAGAYVHVKGKRKAPPPPGEKPPSDTPTSSLKRKKRVAPAPPPIKELVTNDYLKLDHGVLKPRKEDNSPKTPTGFNALTPSSSRGSFGEAPVSPRPWYKRNSTSKEQLVKKENKYEPIERLPEVQFMRNSTLDLTLENTEKNDNKRKSGMSFLTNISELDREAGEIMKNKVEYEKLVNAKNNLENVEIPEFMKPKENKTTDSWVTPKRRSARDLIAKFNAITNVTKVNVFGHKDKYFGKQISLDETKQRQEQLLENHKKRIEDIDKKKDGFTPLVKSESASAVKLGNTPKMERKSWKCPKCNLENEYWRIICHVCSAIKPYFDDFSSTPKNAEVKPETKADSPVMLRRDLPQFERSKTQIGFSALATYNANKKTDKDLSKVDDTSKKDEREKLKKMLIEMKNSLPKRKSNMLVKQNSRSSIIMENPEEEPVKPEKTQEEKVAEILIGTQQTIYENIKVRKSENSKPVKVSSSAQTSAVVRKLVPEASLKKLIENHKANNVYEPMKVKEFEDIYSDPNGKNAAKVYANLAQNDELSLFFNVPKTVADISSNRKNINNDTIEINRLLRRLENAISKGELTEASIFAKELAQLKVNCSVIRQKGVNGKQKGMQIEMYVEDKVSHRGPFPIEVSEKQTVAELKQQISNEFEIPVEVQRWILGKELVVDDGRTLKEHKITEGCAIFLYLVAPEKKSQEVCQPSTSGMKINQPVIALAEKEAPKVVNVIPKSAEPPATKPEVRIISSPKPTVSQVTEIKVDIRPYTSRYQNLPNQEEKKELVRATSTQVQVLQAPSPTPNQPLDVRLSSNQDDNSSTLKPPQEWECHLCTLLNPQSSNICAVCATIRIKSLKRSPKKKPAPQPQKDQTYLQLVNLDSGDLVPNSDKFECLVCFLEVDQLQGVILRECLHQFCKECLAQTVEYSDEAEVKCPYRDEEYSCDIAMQDREIKALVSREVYDQHLAKSMAQAENQMEKTFHCKTPDCKGWCIFEDNVNEFRCPVCRKVNCLTCQAIHMGANCKQYQERMKDESCMNEDAKRTKDFLEEMVEKGEAIACPTCKVILMKKWGCDWLRCSMCKTEICWVTRGPRWGPAGKGDSSGGCQCGVNGVKCHPKCNYCH